MICREPHGDGGRSAFDHPLAVNFDETDALLVFDDVLVPWERVFIYNNVELANAVYPRSNLRNHTAHQTSIRGLVKMQFVVGVAMAIADAVKIDGFLHIPDTWRANGKTPRMFMTVSAHAPYGVRRRLRLCAGQSLATELSRDFYP